MEIQLFVPCFIDHLFPETAFSAIRILEKAGIGVHYNPNQTCCGQPAFNSGYWDEARKIGRKFLQDFSPTLPIVGLSASCCGYIRKQFPVLFEGDFEIGRAKELGGRIFEFSDFLVNQVGITEFGAVFPEKVTYHDACSAIREYGIKLEPRTLLSKVGGLQLIEMEDREECCGFGGTFSAKFTGLSTAMTEQKVEKAIHTGAGIIVSTEASCLMNLQGYIKKAGLPIRVMHLADVLVQGW